MTNKNFIKLLNLIFERIILIIRDHFKVINNLLFLESICNNVHLCKLHLYLLFQLEMCRIHAGCILLFHCKINSLLYYI